MSTSRAAPMPTPLPTFAPALRVRAPGRLHLGFLDPSGTLGRRFGSIGLVVEGFETVVEISPATSLRISADAPAEQAEIERAARCIELLQAHSGRREPLHLRLAQVLPAHAGFGSGTQLALAIGRAFAQWHGLSIDTPTLAHRLARGLRSGIGIGGFDHGGLLVDGGPSADGAPAAILSRLEFPAAWRVLVVQDGAHEGLSGADESQAMTTLPPLVAAHAAEICHQVLMRVLPGAAQADYAPFAAGITRIQRLLGAHFAPAQGGRAFTSAAVGRLIEWIGAQALAGIPSIDDASSGTGAAIGQSSWGPTGFAILPSQAHADAMIAAARAAGVVDAALVLRVVEGRNHGATIVDPRTPTPSR